jgi:hypothetical protein
MESSVQRFCRTGHVNSLPDYLPGSWRVVCGKDGVPRGFVRVYPPWAAGVEQGELAGAGVA